MHKIFKICLTLTLGMMLNILPTFASLTMDTIREIPEDEGFDPTEVTDVLEPYNRAVTFFNDVVDGLIFEPAAEIYDIMAVDSVKGAVHNVLSNATTPYTLVNDLLQAEPERAEQSFGRFIANTIFGLGGVFDVATSYFEIPGHTEDFGQTLAVWGADDGAYFVLPFFGPSTVRDTVGLIAGTFLDPTNIALYRAPNKKYIGRRLVYGYTGLTLLDRRTRAIPVFDYIHETFDPYVTIRGLYLQNREFEIKNGNVDYESPTPDNNT